MAAWDGRIDVVVVAVVVVVVVVLPHDTFEIAHSAHRRYDASLLLPGCSTLAEPVGFSKSSVMGVVPGKWLEAKPCSIPTSTLVNGFHA